MNMVLRIILLFALGLLCTQAWSYANSPIYAYDASGYSYIDQNIGSGTIKPSYDGEQNFFKSIDHPQANSTARIPLIRSSFTICSDFLVTKGVSNSVPGALARVIPGKGPFPTIGSPGSKDVFVTAADDIAGLNAKQLSKRLTIGKSDTFTVIEFPTPSSGIASPVLRNNPGFVGSGRTAGGAREFVIPNQSVPSNTTVRIVK